MTKAQAKSIITTGNRKLNSNIGSWTLPATKEVCNTECKGCYAIKAQKMYPHVLGSRTQKLELSKSEYFVSDTVRALKTLDVDYVRIHDSGEFYSQEYLNKWVEIAKTLPLQVFYAYTKRLKDFNFSELMSLDNVIIIDSMKSNGLNYGKIEDKPEEMVLCPDYRGSALKNKENPICGLTCTYCMTKPAQKTGVYFVKH